MNIYHHILGLIQIINMHLEMVNNQASLHTKVTVILYSKDYNNDGLILS